MANLLNAFTNSVKHWYVPLILGVIFILCSFYIFSAPLETYLTLSILFSLSFIVSGILDIFFSIQNAKILSGWGWYLVSGLLSLGMGIYLIAYPEISIAVLPFVVGFTMLFRSFQLLGFSLDLRDKNLINWGNLALASVLGILFSFMLLANPLFTGISLVTLTALSFLFAGVSAVILAFDLKKVKNYPAKLSKTLREKIEHLQQEIHNEAKG